MKKPKSKKKRQEVAMIKCLVESTDAGEIIMVPMKENPIVKENKISCLLTRLRKANKKPAKGDEIVAFSVNKGKKGRGWTAKSVVLI